MLVACGSPQPAPAPPLTPADDARGWAVTAAFDHDRTGLPLRGAHAALACERCHDPVPSETRTSNTAARACASCHANSPHGPMSVANAACDLCHTDVAWRPARSNLAFDHNATAFTLNEGHRKLACANCHPQAVFEPTPIECEKCHAAQQPHGTLYKGLACRTCHPFSWVTTSVNHGKFSRWPLNGRHAVSKCRDCHRGDKLDQIEKLGKGSDCLGCHEHAQVHNRKYKNDQCLNCHMAPGNVYVKP